MATRAIRLKRNPPVAHSVAFLPLLRATNAQETEKTVARAICKAASPAGNSATAVSTTAATEKARSDH